MDHTVDGCKILHQLVDGRLSHDYPNDLQYLIVTNWYQLVQDFFHPQYHNVMSSVIIGYGYDFMIIMIWRIVIIN